MRTIILFVSCLCLSMSSRLFGQDGQLIKPGPLGRPTAVRDEGPDNWNIPIRVWADRDTEMFVSDQLTLSGIYWDGASFKKDGKFTTYIYSHYKTDLDCRVHRIPKGHETEPDWLDACAELRYNRRLVIVNTREKTMTVLKSDLMKSDGHFHPDMVDSKRVIVPLDGKVNPALTSAANKITEMLVAELRQHPDIR